MFTVTQHRAFLWQGFGWTMRVTCVGDRLNEAGHLAGVDFTEFWQWVTDHITPVAGGNGPLLLVPQQDGALAERFGEVMGRNAEDWTPERLASALVGAFRDLSDTVHAVTVVRSRLSSHGDDTTECTVRPEPTELVTRAQLNHMASMAGLRRAATPTDPGF